MGTKPSERRADERVDVNHRFRGMERYVPSYVANVSRTGAFICTAQKLQPGASLELNHTLFGQGFATLRGSARVVRVSREPRGVGVAFVALTDDSVRVLDSLLERPAAVA